MRLPARLEAIPNRWLAPVLIYGTIPLALLAIIWLQDRGLLADTPLWALVLVTLLTGLANLVTALWLAKRPDGAFRMHVRIAASALGTAAVIYAAGWGPMLVVAYALGSAELLRSVGTGMLRPMLGWNYAAIVAGELAVAAGLAPSVIDPTLGHMVAAVAAVCFTVVTIVLVATARDAELARHNLEERRRYFQELVEHARDVIGDLSPDGTVRRMSPAVSSLLGYSAEEAEGQRIQGHLHPEDAVHVQDAFATVLADPGKPRSYDVRVRHHNGSYRNVVATLTGTEIEGEPTVIANLHDVTRQVELERKLVHDARHDMLTGLLNRRAFNTAAKAATRRADRAGSRLGVMYIDLDGFKEINDTFGHDIGDRVLVEVARRLERCLRPGDVLARLGGDEFAVLVTLGRAADPPVGLADRILGELDHPIPGLASDIRVGASIGIAVREGDHVEIPHVVSDADLAMYEAKGDGHSSWRVAEAR